MRITVLITQLFLIILFGWYLFSEFINGSSNSMQNQRDEYILCAAIICPDKKDKAGEPLIFCGHRHYNILRQSDSVSKHPDNQGFLTNRGRFVSREEAFSIAKHANQVQKTISNLRLFSEDLY